MILLVGIAILVVVLAFVWWKQQHKLQDHEILAKFVVDKNWNNEDNAELNQAVHRFRINVSDDDIQYLNHRLDITR